MRRSGLIVVLAFLLGACTGLRRDFVAPVSSSLPPANETPTTRYVASEVAAHAGQSGFRLLTRNVNALMTRLSLIDHAAQSLDLQYYIVHNDSTGKLVAQRLLAAADRGVRVRLLVDDIGTRDVDRDLAALDAHPQIEVRLFNPFKLRTGLLPARIAQFVFEGQRLNRRMHNKALVADGAVAVVGGRNIGDEYFDAGSDTNFRDLDLIAIGPIVPPIAKSFDTYWNSAEAVPVAAFKGLRVGADDLKAFQNALTDHVRAFADSDYAEAMLAALPATPSPERRGEWFWGTADLVADVPEKADPGRGRVRLRLANRLRDILDGAQHELTIVSPYFVPGDATQKRLVDVMQRGVHLRVLTNAVAATDEPLAFAAYTHYRRGLLKAGAQLYEFAPGNAGGEQPATSLGTSAGAVSLHAKAVVVDGRYTLLGSMNFDLRSQLLNTELGIVVDSPALAAAVTRYVDAATAPANSYRVSLKERDGRSAALTWCGSEAGTERCYTTEPQVRRLRRIELHLTRWLPLDGLL